MANQVSANGWHPAMDAAEHERTYASFIAFTKWGTIAVVVLLILMAIFLL